MCPADEPRPLEHPLPGKTRKLLTSDGWAMLVGAAATVALELGVYLLAVRGGASPREAIPALLGAATVWVALAAPALGAGGKRLVAVMLRTAVPADASAVSLLVVCWISPFVTLSAGVKVYCTLAAMGLLAMAAIACARTPGGRCAVAVVVAVVLMAAASTPFWTGGLLRAFPWEQRRPIAKWSVYANPFYCVTAPFTQDDETRFIWHREGLLYKYFPILGDSGAPPVLWYPSAVICAALAVALGAVAALRSRRGSSRGRQKSWSSG